jgi:hypothetical protein
MKSELTVFGIDFNLAALAPSVDEGLKFMVVLGELGKMSYFSWFKTADPDRTNSSCQTIENAHYIDGQLNVVLFKTRELAEDFAAVAKNEGPHHAIISELGIMELTKGSDSASPVKIKDAAKASQPTSLQLPKII